MDSNNKNIEDLKGAIDKLAISLEKSTIFYDKIITDISAEINDIKEKYVNVSSQIVEAMYDQKNMSKRVFYEYVKLVTTKNMYKCILAINSYFDQNGLTEESRIILLKENINREIAKSMSDCKTTIQEMNYNEDKLERFLTFHRLEAL